MTGNATGVATADGADALPTQLPRQRNLFVLSGTARQESAADKTRKADWLSATGKLLVRHLNYGDSLESCSAELDIPLHLATARIDQAKLLSRLPVGLKFKRGHASGLRYPADLVHTGTAKASEEIALGLQRLAKRDPELVKRSIDTYTHNLQESNCLLLTKRDWRREEAGAENKLAHFQDVIRFVKLLHVAGLTVQCIGYTLASVRPDLRSKLQLLGLNRRTHVHWVQSQNKRSRATSDQLGLRIGYSIKKDNTSQVNSSNAFRYVMCIAAICEVWRQPVRPRRPLHGQASGIRIPDGRTEGRVQPKKKNADTLSPGKTPTIYEFNSFWNPEIDEGQPSLFSFRPEIN